MSEKATTIRVDPKAKLLVGDIAKWRYAVLEVERDKDAIEVDAIRIDEPSQLTQGD